MPFLRTFVTIFADFLSRLSGGQCFGGDQRCCRSLIVLNGRQFLRRPGTGVLCNILIISRVQKMGVTGPLFQGCSGDTAILYMLDGLQVTNIPPFQVSAKKCGCCCTGSLMLVFSRSTAGGINDLRLLRAESGGRTSILLAPSVILPILRMQGGKMLAPSVIRPVLRMLGSEMHSPSVISPVLRTEQVGSANSLLH